MRAFYVVLVCVTVITVRFEPIWDVARIGTQGDVMRYFNKTRMITRIALMAAAHVATPAAAASFDGQWNVQIASSSSVCGGATVAIGINNGRVESSNAMVTASGHVADAGSISVTLVSGIKRAVGSGHLSATSGSGTWRAALCSGTWTAQRI
jgi:hypothetical protein